MKKLLVTGAGGFIGKAVLAKLADAESLQIYALTRGARQFAQENVITLRLDLMELSAIDQLFAAVQPDMVLHLAWKMTAASDRFNLDNISWLRVSLQILHAFAASGGQRFVFAGSSSEYGGDGVCAAEDTFHGFGESAAAHPNCLYGECKLAFGCIAARILRHIGKEYAHARIFPVYGPGEFSQYALTAAAAAAILGGAEFVGRAPNNLWDFVYIDDAAADLTRLLLSNFCGVVNIASGSPIRVGKLLRLLAAAAGRSDLLRLENLDQPGRILYGNTELMNKVLDNPKRTLMEQGIKNAVAWRKALI
jgi:nucleoside-diphosphate-sugar epimerase